MRLNKLSGRVYTLIATGIILAALILALCGCSSSENTSAGRETVMQVSTIDALMAGVYDGISTLGDIKKSGDFGVGTFDKLDGEMLVLDGTVYQIKTDGKAYQPADSVTAPFAAVTFFDSDQQKELTEGMTMADFQKLVSGTVPTANIFYAVKVKGTFSYMKTRSVPSQTKPYPILSEVTKNQAVFEFNDIQGTIVGFLCPPFVQGVNVPGYHLHFLTDKQDAGGHILDFKVKNATLYIDETANFLMKLPGADSDFYNLDLSQNKEAELEKVEK